MTCTALFAAAAVSLSPCAGVARYDTSGLSSVVVAHFLTAPVFVTAPRGDPARLFIVERGGRIRLRKRGDAPATYTTFLDITSRVYSSEGETGLLGLAFDPGYMSTLHFWVHYNELVGGQIFTVVARYSAMPTDPDLADPASELRVLRFAQPQTNHKGGTLAFGKDGFLYLFTGDGGGGGDQHGTCGNGQNLTVLLGKILRIDVRGIDPNSQDPDCGEPGGVYGVPSSNPFADGPGGLCDEVWALGLRNPWRASFDGETGDLFIADVGEACWEELNWASFSSPGGENYGWRQKEGAHCFDQTFTLGCDPPPYPCAGSPDCDDPTLVDPMLEHSHADGVCAVIGGYVYRGCRLPDWTGRYFYGDLCAGFVKSFRTVGGSPVDPLDHTDDLTPTGEFAGLLGSFGEDGQGEIYVVTLDGRVRKIVPPFRDLEVAARGTGAPFRLGKSGSWTWEDLYLATDVAVAFYRVYRGPVGGAYACVLKTTTPGWPAGGDPLNPSGGQLFSYVVTAVDATGQETRPGAIGSFDPSTCP